jgi:hypothetical protein
VVGPAFGRAHAWVVRRTGAVRQTALLYVRVGADALALLGANAGNDAPPAWWLA